MSVIAILGEKGGTGKSTIVINLAIMRTLMGRDVMLIDTDKQESSSKFISNRNERGVKPTPPCVQLRGKHVGAEIEDLSKRCEDVFVDAGGRDSVEMRAALASPAVKRVYSPLQPSEFDLETLGTMDELVYLSRAYNPNLEAFVLFNQAPTHSKITVTEEAMEFTENFENIKLCKSIISHRVPIQYAISQGQCVVEFEVEKIKTMPAYQAKKYQPKASLEMCALYKEIFNEEFKNEILDEYKLSAVAA